MNKEAAIWIIAVIVVLGGGWYLYRQGSMPPAPAEETLPNVFADATRGFSFSYPNELALADTSGEDVWRAGTAAPGILLARLDLSRDFQPGTNFSEARFGVGMSEDPAAVAGCLTDAGGSAVQAEQVLIDGREFAKLSFADAGAGNRYETTSYRTVKDGACYAVEYTVHSTNIGNYPTELGVHEFDDTAVRKTLEKAARSFKFLP